MRTIEIIHNVKAWNPALDDPNWLELAQWDAAMESAGWTQPVGVEQQRAAMCSTCNQDPPCLPGRCRQGSAR